MKTDMVGSSLIPSPHPSSTISVSTSPVWEQTTTDMNVSMLTMPSLRNASELDNLTNEIPPYFLSITACTCILSMIGCILIVITYIAFKEIRTISRKLLVYLSIADFFTAFGNLLGISRYIYNYTNLVQVDCDTPDGLCLSQSIITTFSSMSSFFWTVAIAVYLYMSIVWDDTSKANKCIWMYHVACWGVPAALTILAWRMDVLGEDGSQTSAGWCWIKTCADGLSKKEEFAWMLLTGKGWEILAYFVTPVLYGLIKCHIRRAVHKTHQIYIDMGTLQAVRRANRKLTFVPAIFIFLRIWGTFRFFWAATGKSLNTEIGVMLQIFQGFGDSGQGFLNCILFCLSTDKVREKLKPKCCRCVHCKSGPQNNNRDSFDNEDIEKSFSLNDKSYSLNDKLIQSSVTLYGSRTPRAV